MKNISNLEFTEDKYIHSKASWTSIEIILSDWSESVLAKNFDALASVVRVLLQAVLVLQLYLNWDNRVKVSFWNHIVVWQ